MTGPRIESGTDIAVATDGDSTSYIFYQDADDGHIVRALDYGRGIGNQIDLMKAAPSTKLKAVYGPSDLGSGVMVMYREELSPGVAYEQTDRSGSTIGSDSLG